jgi:hypothetical protein
VRWAEIEFQNREPFLTTLAAIAAVSQSVYLDPSGLCSFIRCVHISEAVLRQLKGEFQVIPADGGSRDEYLRDNHIETFFIAESEVRIIDSSLAELHPCLCSSVSYKRHVK